MGLLAKINFDKELARIKREAVDLANKTIQERTDFATEALRSTTPVDTGYAASRWTYEMVKEGVQTVGKITNDAPYIGILNAGWSKQAPPFFIERVLITIGELSAPVEFKE